MRRSITLLPVLLPLFAVACGGTSVQDCPASSEEAVCEVFRLVNEARADAGRPPMVWDSALARAAQDHAEDMVANGYFAHTSQDGRTFSNRADQAGYDAFASGENIARGHSTPESVMAGWMNSDGHRRNILSEGSNEIGIGLDGATWVQVFGSRR